MSAARSVPNPTLKSIREQGNVVERQLDDVLRNCLDLLHDSELSDDVRLCLYSSLSKFVNGCDSLYLFLQKQFRSLELEKRKMSVGVEDEVSVPPQSTSQEHPTDNFARFLELKESAQTIEKILGPELTRARRHRK